MHPFVQDFDDRAQLVRDHISYEHQPQRAGTEVPLCACPEVI